MSGFRHDSSGLSMLQDFFLIHYLKPQVFAETSSPVWATCLRSLAFIRFGAQSGDEIYAQNGAYRFLLEVICGLKSQIVGETEVFGQIKIFAQEWLKNEPKRAGLIQRNLTDANAIRSEHLTQMGTQPCTSCSPSVIH